jgi:pectate lyase
MNETSVRRPTIGSLTRPTGGVRLTLLVVAIALGGIACGPTSASGGSGGATGSGGRGGTGGASASGGNEGSGGSGGGAGGDASGGGTASGGRTASGGAPSSSGGASGASGGPGGGAGRTGDGGAAASAGKGGAGARGGAGGSITSSGGMSGRGGSVGSGGSGACAIPTADPVVGWAALSGGTTGGGAAATTTVTTLAAFTTAVSGNDASVVVVKGVLSAGSVRVGSNKTIAGVCGAEIHGHLEINGSSNVIVRNLKIVGYGVGNCALDPGYDASVGCSSGDDAVTVQGASHIWFDHCDVSDGTDGNLDIVNGSDYVTVSWTKFHYTPRTDNDGDDSTGAAGHRFSNLVGGSDSKTSDAGKLNVTWHHDWWSDNVVERQPRVRFGKNHLFNNLWSSAASSYCVRAGIQAQILIESSIFSGVKSPHEFNGSGTTSDKATANITAGASNAYPNSTGTKDTGGGGPAYTSAGYPFTAEPIDELEAAIRSGAGPH